RFLGAANLVLQTKDNRRRVSNGQWFHIFYEITIADHAQLFMSLRLEAACHWAAFFSDDHPPGLSKSSFFLFIRLRNFYPPPGF
ncbi:MAG TPA: hypothetical protein VKY85_23125, partial [Candidatus Angelobacter sp.]|nr:hypothetical protein [Candidatus Angelobacter sp.]